MARRQKAKQGSARRAERSFCPDRTSRSGCSRHFLEDRGRMTLALYRRRAFRKKVCTRAVLRRAFDKAVRRKPPVVAADAGLMQIQLWEGSLSRCAEAVRQSTTDDSGS